MHPLYRGASASKYRASEVWTGKGYGMKSAIEERTVYTVDEVARVLGIGRNTAYLAIRRGEIPSVRIGARILIPKVALDALLQPAG